MAEYSSGRGEEIERATRRRRQAILAALFVLGMGLGIYLGRRHEEMPLFSGAADWPPSVALAGVALYVGAILASTVFLSKTTDEVQRQSQYKATALAAAVYFLGYPVWFLLWKGGFVPEPAHEILFGVFWVALAASSIYYRFR